METQIEGIPGAKAFFSAVAVKVIGPEAHHRQHRVVEFDPERGHCTQNGTLYIKNIIKCGNDGAHTVKFALWLVLFLRPELLVHTCPHVRTQAVRSENPHYWFKESWITYPQLGVVEIPTAHKHHLCHKALRQMPGPGDGHCQVVCDVSMYPSEGRWEVSAVGQIEWQVLGSFSRNSTNSCPWNSISWPPRKILTVKQPGKVEGERFNSLLCQLS